MVDDKSMDVLIRAYREGIKDGITRYAVWKNGEQLVGVSARPLAQVLAEVELEDGYMFRVRISQILQHAQAPKPPSPNPDRQT